MRSAAPPEAAASSRARLAWLLAVSYGLRVWLAVNGGQAYWPDEARYGLTREAVYQFVHQHWRLAFEALLAGADHVFFRWVGLPAAFAEHLLGGDHPALAACYFGLFSVGSIFLIWAVAIRAGAPDAEALWAAFFAAASNSLFYYTRHYLPYDVALFAMLLGLWLSLGRWSPRRALLAGVAVGFGFLTYNGYWLLGACVLTLYALLGAGGPRLLPARACVAFAGLVLPLALFLALGVAVTGTGLSTYLLFAQAVKQGDFHIGFRVIAEYLWHSERAMLVVLLGAFCFALVSRPAGGERRRLILWSASVMFIYCGLVIFSDIIPIFMVYGRLSRSLVPFLCLGAGAGAARFLGERGASRRFWTQALFLGTACLAALNFSVPLRQEFPDAFRRDFFRKLLPGAGGKFRFYRALNVESFWGKPGVDLSDTVGAEELLRRPNPIQFRPYQYEGYSEAQRSKFNAGDPSMRVYGTTMRPRSPDPWSGYPGPFELGLKFPKDRSSFAEPLFSSGRGGSADTIFVRYVDSSHIQFGLDHWGAGAIESKVLEVDYDRTHDLIVSTGSLLPPPGDALYAKDPLLLPMRGHILMTLDGRTVLSRHADFFMAAKESIVFGANLIGASTAGQGFNGVVSSFAQLSPSDVEQLIPMLAGARLAQSRTPEWAGAVGPVRMRFVMPKRGEGPEEAQPLASIEGASFHEVLYIVREGGKAAINLDSFANGALFSEKMDLSQSGSDEVEFSIGTLLPEAGAPLFSHAPNLAGMRDMVFITLNHRLALFAHLPFRHPGLAKIVFGANVPGSSACAAYFNGEITSVESIGLGDIPAGRSAGSEYMTKLARTGWDGYTGPLAIDLRFAEGRPGDGQPILTTGVQGKGDIVFVRYEDDGYARICVDHWGTPLTVSEAFTPHPGTLRSLVVSIGSLYPPGGVSETGADAAVASLMRRIIITIDGRSILNCENPAYPALPESATIGANFIGGSSAGTVFYGKIERITQARLADVGR